MGKPKLLFICGQIMPSSSQGVRYLNLLPLLADDYDITVVSINDFLGDAYNIERYYIKRIPSRDHFSHKVGLARNVKEAMKQSYKSLLRPFIFPDRFRFYRRKLWHLIKQAFQNKGNYDLVMIGMTPFSLYELASPLKNQFRVKIVCDLSDPFTYSGHRYRNPVIRKLVAWYECQKLTKVDQVVVLNPKIADIYHEKLNFPRVSVIEQGLSQFPKITEPTTSKQKDSLKLIYAGGLYPGFREAFNLYQAIEEINGKASLDIYGNIGSDQLPQSNIEKIQYHGAIAPNELQKRYAEADVIVFIDNRNGFQVPGKVLEIQALGLPILFIYDNEASPSFDYLFNEGIVRVQNNVEAIKVALLSTKLKESTPIKVSQELVRFSWSNLARKYKVVMND